MAEGKPSKRCITASAIIIENGKALLIKHKKLGVWMPPGGHVEENEFPSEAAVREAKEETGLDIELVGMQNVKFSFDDAHTELLPFAIVYEEVPYSTGMHVHFDSIYLAKAKGGKQELNEKESTSIGWFSKEEIEKLETYPNVAKSVKAALEAFDGSNGQF
ncbi:MAG: NUDIX hydrolase [Candidatus Micrarchaeia archaeon]